MNRRTLSFANCQNAKGSADRCAKSISGMSAFSGHFEEAIGNEKARRRKDFAPVWGCGAEREVGFLSVRHGADISTLDALPADPVVAEDFRAEGEAVARPF